MFYQKLKNIFAIALAITFIVVAIVLLYNSLHKQQSSSEKIYFDGLVYLKNDVVAAEKVCNCSIEPISNIEVHLTLPHKVRDSKQHLN